MTARKLSSLAQHWTTGRVTTAGRGDEETDDEPLSGQLDHKADTREDAEEPMSEQLVAEQEAAEESASENKPNAKAEKKACEPNAPNSLSISGGPPGLPR